MTTRWVFKKVNSAVGGLLMALAAGIQTQLISLIPSYPDQLKWLAVTLFVGGLVVSVSAFLEISVSAGSVYPVWRSDLIEQALRRADPQATISVLQTSFPNAADLIPLLKNLLTIQGKQFKIRLLLANPFTPTGNAVIAARMRLRDQTAEHHELEIEDHIKQFISMKVQVDAAWQKDRDQAKLDLQIRLYDHLPFGPQYHVEGDASFIGFFVAKHSSLHAPMLRLRKRNGTNWESFQEDFDHVWKAATPHKP